MAAARSPGSWLPRWLRPLLLPVLVTAAAWTVIAFLHSGRVGVPSEGLVLEQAAFVDPGGAHEPVPVELPHEWESDHPRAVRGQYRAELELPAHLEAPLALYFPSVNTRTRVLWDGVVVDEGDRFRDLHTHFWHLPLYVPLAADAQAPGRHVLELEMELDTPGGGYLGRIHAGPAAPLRRAYEVRNFLQITFVQVSIIAMLGFGLFMASLWLLRRKDPSYLWFALAIGVWAFGYWNLLAVEAFVPKPSWRWVGMVTMAWLVTAIVGFTQSFLRIHRPRVVLGYATVSAVASVFFLLTEGSDLFTRVRPFWGALVLLSSLYPSALVLRETWRRPTFENQLVLTIGVLIFTTGMHDVLQVNGGISLEHDPAIQYAGVVGIGVFGLLYLLRFIEALDTSEALTAELEQRVREKHAELEGNYRRVRHLEQEQVLARERERIMEEIHDGMGGQLVSTLAMLEGGGAAEGEIEGALRAALDDMRLMIHSLDAYADLPMVLATLRERLSPRLRAAGIEVRWKVGDVPELEEFGPEKSLAVMRILQEAITNVLKHAKARVLTFETGLLEDDASRFVFVSITDDGLGLDGGSGQPVGGRGLGNMRRRAAALGARLEIGGTALGTRVRLALPVDSEAD